MEIMQHPALIFTESKRISSVMYQFYSFLFFFSIQAWELSQLDSWGQEHSSYFWPRAALLPYIWQPQPCLVLHLWQHTLGQKYRANTRYRQGALELELHSLLFPVLGHESHPRRLCDHSAYGAEVSGPTLPEKNRPAPQWKPGCGLCHSASAWCVSLPSPREPEKWTICGSRYI